MRRAVGAVVAALKCVGPAAPVTLASSRLAVCQRCPELTAKLSCRICGCYMPRKVTCTQEVTVSGVKSVVCPLGKW